PSPRPFRGQLRGPCRRRNAGATTAAGSPVGSVLSVRRRVAAMGPQTRPLAGALVELASDNNAVSRADPRPDEAQAVAALRHKDHEAFETVVRRFGGRMLATARRYLPGEEDGADAVQDAFLSAFQAIDRFEGKSQLATWLHRIVVNACLMKLRSRS